MVSGEWCGINKDNAEASYPKTIYHLPFTVHHSPAQREQVARQSALHTADQRIGDDGHP
jgi:hypothetical protein